MPAPIPAEAPGDRPEWEGGKVGDELVVEVEMASGDEEEALVAGNVTFGMVLFAPAKRRVVLLI